MAYRNLIAVSCNNSTETFKRFRDFVCRRNGSYDYSSTGIGWDLIDSSYVVNQDTISNNDWFVIKSLGENGLREIYYRIQYSTTGIFNVVRYLYWNTTTHTGTQAVNGGQWSNTVATNNILWVYGDLDQIIGIAKYGTSYNTTIFGWMPESAIDQSFVVAPGAISSGSNRTVTFSSTPPAAWVVGKKLFVEDQNNIERVQITAVSGNDVTFASFVASYAAGAKFSQEKTDFVTSANAASTWYLLIDHAGTKSGSTAPVDSTMSQPTAGDALTGEYPSRRVYTATTSIFMGPVKNILATVSLTSESTHMIGSVGYRYFNLYSGLFALIKEV